MQVCYANANKKLVIENMKKHNENSPFLIGNVEAGDKITEAKQIQEIGKRDNVLAQVLQMLILRSGQIV